MTWENENENTPEVRAHRSSRRWFQGSWYARNRHLLVLTLLAHDTDSCGTEALPEFFVVLEVFLPGSKSFIHERLKEMER